MVEPDDKEGNGQRIRLPGGLWTYFPDQPVGPPGGFGRVFKGQDESGSPVAIKQLHLSADAAAHRELRVASELAGRAYEHVMPTYDSGQDAETGRYYVVMPLAEHSLRDHITRSKPPETEAVSILGEILAGLREVPELVHRDLKPDNVLWYGGHWRIADFGIARFVEESTSAETLRSSLTPLYAAPEQWLLQTPSNATDLYALGCIAYELLTGSPPFSGDPSELRRQHLADSPPKLATERPRLAALVYMLLRKDPRTRPSPQRVERSLEALEGDDTTPSQLSRLASHGAQLAQRAAEVEASLQRAAIQRESEEKLAAEGVASLRGIAIRLIDLMAEQLPTAQKHLSEHIWTLSTSGAELQVNAGQQGPGRKFREGLYVLAGGSITVSQRASHKPYEWSANLWFARAGDDHGFRWYEVGYMDSVLLSGSNRPIPFNVTMHEAADATASGMAGLQVAYQHPLAIDDEDETSFQNRWVRIFAEALEGRLRYPSVAPFDPRSLFG